MCICVCVHLSIVNTQDATYQDPIGELPARKLASGTVRQQKDDSFDEDELGDDLLPE